MQNISIVTIAIWDKLNWALGWNFYWFVGILMSFDSIEWDFIQFNIEHK